MSEGQRRCRICLQIENSQKSAKMSSIFDKSNIAVDIYLCTQIKIVETSNSAALICENCSNDLKIAKRFRTNAVKADNYFKQHFNVIKIEQKIKSEPDEVNSEIFANAEVLLERSSDSFENVDVDFYQDEIPEEIAKVEKSSKKRKYEEKEVDVKCNYCNKLFKKSYIKRHLKRAHADRDREKKPVTNDDDDVDPNYCQVSSQ